MQGRECLGGRPTHSAALSAVHDDSWCLRIPAVQRQWALQGMQRPQGKAKLGLLKQQVSAKSKACLLGFVPLLMDFVITVLLQVCEGSTGQQHPRLGYLAHFFW